jgi:hypothetical protein
MPHPAVLPATPATLSSTRCNLPDCMEPALPARPVRPISLAMTKIADETVQAPDQLPRKPATPPPQPKEIGGTTGPEPTRYGDWEHKGRCTDF